MRLYHISLNNLKRRWAKMVFLLLGLVIAVATMVSLVSISKNMEKDIMQKLDEYGANILVVPESNQLSLSYGGMAISGLSFAPMELKEADLRKIKTIKNAENIGIISPKLLAAAKIKGKDALLVGVSFAEELHLKKWWKIRGRAPQKPQEVLVGQEAAEKLALGPGEEILLKNERLKVVGVLAPTGSQDDSMIFASLPTVQRLYNKKGTLSLVELAAFCNSCPIEAIVAQLTEVLPGARVTAVKETVQLKMEAMSHFQRFSWGISLLVLLIGGLIVFVTMSASVKERTREIGIFRAIGFRQSHIMRIILLEALIIGLLGGMIGYGLGLAAAGGLSPYFTGQKGFQLSFNYLLVLESLGLSVAVGILASLYPAWAAARLDPTEALRAL
jgi:putative ABC transport system permease protein